MARIHDTNELNKELLLAPVGRDQNCARRILVRRDNQNFLPGQPRIALSAEAELDSYLRANLAVLTLDRVSRFLVLVSTPFHGHISPLHHQAARSRTIVPTEKPHLHLLWYYDRIFIKPIPPYLLSSVFWVYLEHRMPDVARAARGFMRTYSFLIRYQRDFDLAQREDLKLIPVDDGTRVIDFVRFAAFIHQFDDIDDAEVAARYHYGELRLSRLNLLAPLLFRKLTYHHMNAQWSTLLSKVFAFTLTVFLVLSTILSAMQVRLQAQDSTPKPIPINFAFVCDRFSAGVMMFILLVVGSYFLLGTFMLCHDALFSTKVVFTKKRPSKIEARDLSSNAI